MYNKVMSKSCSKVAWINMIQPFWALPELGIAGLGARDIMGFCLIDLVYTGFIIALGLMFL